MEQYFFLIICGGDGKDVNCAIGCSLLETQGPAHVLVWILCKPYVYLHVPLMEFLFLLLLSCNISIFFIQFAEA